jgi:deoxyribodipyrimidine photo-lyase
VAETYRIQRNDFKNFNSHRVFVRREGEPRPDGEFVMYWMQIHRRMHSNYALEYAIGHANRLGKPLLIVEALRQSYPWASDRVHSFIMQGMREHLAFARKRGLNYYAFLEDAAHSGKGMLEGLATRACLIVSDEFPAYIIPAHNRALTEKLVKNRASDVPFITIDANGVIPLQATDKAPYSAYVFRNNLQKKFAEAWSRAPLDDPLKKLNSSVKIAFPAEFALRYPRADAHLRGDVDMQKFIVGLPIDHSVKALSDVPGTRAAALKRLTAFADRALADYSQKRNDPDAAATSGLSPYLHFGKISSFELVAAAFARQPRAWNVERLAYNKGSKGFFSAGGGLTAIDDFLDEALTWRETGYHFCHHTPNYDQFESLPDWARDTLTQHAKDPREHLYTLEQLRAGETHDDVWNAAQRQLVKTGVIHNYLRMLWGKKILEWTASPEQALEILIELNNLYSIDGRNPNSYSGVFWTLGRFDRPWQERPIFGKIRYMSSPLARKKIAMENYLERFGENAPREQSLFE